MISEFTSGTGKKECELKKNVAKPKEIFFL